MRCIIMIMRLRLQLPFNSIEKAIALFVFDHMDKRFQALALLGYHLRVVYALLAQTCLKCLP